jgi:hypothetical protein
MSYLFQKKSVSERKDCRYYFHKKIKNFKKPQKIFLVGFLCRFFGIFWVGFLLPTLSGGDSGADAAFDGGRAEGHEEVGGARLCQRAAASHRPQHGKRGVFDQVKHV